MWPYVIAAVVSAASSLYGAKQQEKAQNKAADMNAKLQEEANRINEQHWRESQGIGENGEPINTFLPRWAMVQTVPTKRRFKIASTTAPPAFQATTASSSSTEGSIGNFDASPPGNPSAALRPYIRPPR